MFLLKLKGYLKDGDFIMADKEFAIKEKLSKLNFMLNDPPMVLSTPQISVSDTILTEKNSEHRLHIERLIANAQIKKMLFVRIPTS